jgi:hypothetical protein
MKKQFTILFFIANFLFINNIYCRQVQKLLLDGIDITVSKLKGNIRGPVFFNVKASNSNEGDRSFSGTIRLFTKENTPAGECVVYLELKPGATGESSFSCKLSPGAELASWKFEMTNIFDFIIEKDLKENTSDEMDKSVNAGLIAGKWHLKDSSPISGWLWDFDGNGAVQIDEILGPQARIPLHYSGSYRISGNKIEISVQGRFNMPAEFIFENGNLASRDKNYILLKIK